MSHDMSDPTMAAAMEGGYAQPLLTGGLLHRLQQRRAGLYASPALLPADPTVLMVLGVTLALLGASDTRLEARGQLRLRCRGVVVRLPSEDASRRLADVGTVEAEAYASAHVGDILLG